MSTRTPLKTVSWFVITWVVATALVSCHFAAQSQFPTRPHPVYAGSAPPEARAETPSPQSEDDQVWLAGYWHWSEMDGVWQWRDGRWVSAPHKDSLLVEASYEQRGDVWVYTAPYWKTSDTPVEPLPYPETKTDLSAAHEPVPSVEEAPDPAADEQNVTAVAVEGGETPVDEKTDSGSGEAEPVEKQDEAGAVADDPKQK